MPTENATPNRGYQLPDGSNNLEDDVLRLIAALSAIDVDIAGLLVSVAQRALLVHSHVIADTTGLQAALDSKQNESEKGNANGYAELDATGKVPAAQLPSALFGSLSYQGTWNANTNTPTIPAASSANRGQYYKVATAGATNVSGITDWQIGDWIVSNGTAWDKIDNTDQVSSVAGLVGTITVAALKTALVLVKADVGLGNVDNTADSAKPVSTAQAAADALKADKATTVSAGGLATGGGDLSASRTITVTKSTNAQAMAGTDDTTAMTPLRVKDAITALSPAPNYGVGNAALAYGAVGTYVFGYSLNSTGIVDGSTYAGSAIQPAGVTTNVGTDPGDDVVFGSGSITGVKGGSTLSGTWRAMGRVNNSAGSNRLRQTLFLRVS
ncbi:hypothetical protein [Mesorhizobium sp. WSM3860]|uniref:hypothetical protein n=1 Tax=Mesorhizobium sp. WSM3860 TaxID=2029403 RepID=UPI000BAEB2BD|nr:hypothetical protein [Mesorhizobium sp. WSM3860]PBC02677.1 hypothetical protein CK220_19610 [Mesorhizobium sp. WSM3860]